MTNLYFSEIETWCVPEMAIADALEEMAIDGREGNEGIVLFLGREMNAVAQVTHLLRLRGTGVEKYPARINIDATLLNDVTDVAIGNNVRLIGQVHSHGPGYGLDLSSTDRIFGIRTPYYLSLVAPDYALSAAPLKQWGVHVFMENGGWVRLGPSEAKRRLQVIPDAVASVITVGGADGL